MRRVIFLPTVFCLIVMTASLGVRGQNPRLPVGTDILKRELNNQATLKDLGPIDVSAEGADQMLSKGGLTKENIEIYVSTKLKAAGITIDEKALPTFLVNVHAIDIGGQRIAFKVRAELYQEVRLERRKNVLTLAPTWMIDGIGTAKTSELHKVLEAISAALDKFITQYKSENGGPEAKP